MNYNICIMCGGFFFLKGGTDFSNNPASGFSQISPNSSSPGQCTLQLVNLITAFVANRKQ